MSIFFEKLRNSKYFFLLRWRFWASVGGVIVGLSGIYSGYVLWADRHSVKPNLVNQNEAEQSNLISRKEYIFGNQYFCVQVLTDELDTVKAYAITAIPEFFKPKFSILGIDVQLNKTTYSEIPDEPIYVFSYQGAHDLQYYEKHYLANPGNYQSIFLATNDAGYLKIGDLEFNTNIFDANNQEIEAFRESSVINTIMVTSPFEGSIISAGQVWVGVKLNQMRVVPEKLISTKEPITSLNQKLSQLSTEVSIDYFIQFLGKPIVINDLQIDTSGSQYLNLFDNMPIEP